MASTDIIALRIYAEPQDALVYINGRLCNVYCCTKGEIIEWSVSKEGYTPQSGTIEMDKDRTLYITLERGGDYATLKINASPEGCVVSMNDIEGAEQTFVKGTFVAWKVENLPEYITKEGSLELNEDTELDIALERLYKVTAKVEFEPLD